MHDRCHEVAEILLVVEINTVIGPALVPFLDLSVALDITVSLNVHNNMTFSAFNAFKILFADKPPECLFHNAGIHFSRVETGRD